MTPDETPAQAGTPEAPPAAEPEVDQLHADAPEPGDPRVPDVPPTAEPGPVAAESPALRATLRRIFADPQYRPAAGSAGAAGELSDAEVDKLWADYQSVPYGEEKQAYKRMLTQATDLALKRAQGERAAESNKQRAVQQATELKSAITAQVQQVAPGVDLDLFWEWGAHVAQREAMARKFPDVTAALDWQVRRAIQLVQAKMGTPPAARRTRGTSQPAPRGRSMVEQLNAMQRVHRGDY
jgi:hypothetical protein